MKSFFFFLYLKIYYNTNRIVVISNDYMIKKFAKNTFFKKKSLQNITIIYFFFPSKICKYSRTWFFLGLHKIRLSDWFSLINCTNFKYVTFKWMKFYLVCLYYMWCLFIAFIFIQFSYVFSFNTLKASIKLMVFILVAPHLSTPNFCWSQNNWYLQILNFQ